MKTLRDSAKTRSRILEAARGVFVERGYEGTTVRAVAAEAGVAPNLVTRYFGGKAGLYREAVDLDIEDGSTYVGPMEELGERLSKRIVTRWKHAGPDDPLQMLMRSAGSNEEAASLFGEFLAVKSAIPLINYLVETTGCTRIEAGSRVAGINAFVTGVALQRQLLRSGPVAAAGHRSLQTWMGEQLQRLIDGPTPPRLASLGTWASIGTS